MTKSPAVIFACCLALAALAARPPHTPTNVRAQQQPAASPTQTPPPRTGRSYDSGAPVGRPQPSAPQQPSPVTFADITAPARVAFRHAASPTSQKYLPETMCGGVA